MGVGRRASGVGQRGIALAVLVVSTVAGCRQILGIDDPRLVDARAGDGRRTQDGARDGMAGGDATLACDPATCATAGGTCSGTTCVIDVTGSNAICPQGQTCAIDCTADNSCAQIDCSLAAACTITCVGKNSCTSSEIYCTDPAGCTVYCTGQMTCSNDSFTCNGAGCTVQCCGINTCAGDSYQGTHVENVPGTCP